MILRPRQADADSLLFKIWQSRVARHPKAIRAAQAMERWHRDPRTEGRIEEVRPVIVSIRRARRGRR